MKKSFYNPIPDSFGKVLFLGAFLSILSFGCSIDSDTSLVDNPQNQVEKSFHLEMSKFLKSPEYKNALEAIYSNPNFKVNGQGNGAFVISSPYGQYYSLNQDIDEDGIADLGYNFGVPAGEFTQKHLPNGKIQFAVNSNHAEAFVNKVVGYEDFGFFKWYYYEPLYSNICEGSNGNLFGKVTGEVVEIELWPGFFVYILEPGTSDILNLKATVKDSYKGDEIDWDTFESIPICEEASVSKSLAIKILSIQNNKNPSIDFNIKLD